MAQSKGEKIVLTMATITIENLSGKTIVFDDLRKTLLQHFHENRQDWMQACGGKGRCTTCRVVIRSGKENLDPETVPELRYRAKMALGPLERLSCQCKVHGDVVISVPEDCKLPHLPYSD